MVVPCAAEYQHEQQPGPGCWGGSQQASELGGSMSWCLTQHCSLAAGLGLLQRCDLLSQRQACSYCTSSGHCNSALQAAACSLY